MRWRGQIRTLGIAQLRAHRSAPARPVIGWAPTLDPLVLLSGIAARRSLALSRGSSSDGYAADAERSACAFAQPEAWRGRTLRGAIPLEACSRRRSLGLAAHVDPGAGSWFRRDDALVDHRLEEDVMEPVPLLDCAGRRRSPATLPGYHQGRPPRNRGLRYPPDPPTVEEIIAVMRAAGDDREGVRLRGLIVVLWRAGLRISEALALTETDLDADRGAILVRRGKGGRRREVGMDRWAFEQLDSWLEIRRQLPVGPLFCVVRGPTRGRPCSTPAMRDQLRDAAAKARVRRRFAPHQLRHAHAVEMSREGVPLVVIQRQLGHTNLGVTSVYLRGIDNTEIIHTVHERPAPVIAASNALRICP
jgi:integrase